MTGTVQPAVSAGAGEIAFELERFDRSSDQLRLTGRWFGVRGRRFVRPTLTPLGAADRSRVLADLEHKPWPAEDGGPWEAAFPWDADRSVGKFELSVSPDIVIQLPSPNAKLDRPRRLTALPARRPTTPGWRPDPEDQAENEAPSPPVAPSELELARAELDVVGRKLKSAHVELEAARGELADREGELEATRAQLAAATADRDVAGREVADVAALRDQLIAERDQLYGDRHQLGAERDKLVAERDELGADRDAAAAERDTFAAERAQLKAERDRLRHSLAQLEAKLEQATSSLEQASRARDDAATQRGAALVMRGAARAPHHYEPPHSWWKPTLAVLALLAVAVAVLIVTHIL
jgi:hypothetical protein